MPLVKISSTGYKPGAKFEVINFGGIKTDLVK